MKTHPIVVLCVLLMCGTFGYSQSTRNSPAVPADEAFVAHAFTELGRQLTEYGTTVALDEATKRLLGRYEQMPAAGQTRETRAGHALALAGVGAVGGWV